MQEGCQSQGQATAFLLQALLNIGLLIANQLFGKFLITVWIVSAWYRKTDQSEAWKLSCDRSGTISNDVADDKRTCHVHLAENMTDKPLFWKFAKLLSRL